MRIARIHIYRDVPIYGCNNRDEGELLQKVEAWIEASLPDNLAVNRIELMEEDGEDVDSIG